MSKAYLYSAWHVFKMFSGKNHGQVSTAVNVFLHLEMILCKSQYWKCKEFPLLKSLLNITISSLYSLIIREGNDHAIPTLRFLKQMSVWSLKSSILFLKTTFIPDISFQGLCGETTLALLPAFLLILTVLIRKGFSSQSFVTLFVYNCLSNRSEISQ